MLVAALTTLPVVGTAVVLGLAVRQMSVARRNDSGLLSALAENRTALMELRASLQDAQASVEQVMKESSATTARPDVARAVAADRKEIEAAVSDAWLRPSDVSVPSNMKLLAEWSGAFANFQHAVQTASASMASAPGKKWLSGVAKATPSPYGGGRISHHNLQRSVTIIATGNQGLPWHPDRLSISDYNYGSSHAS